MKRKWFTVLIVMLPLFLGGCWNSRELNKLGIVSATAIDLDSKKQWVVTYQVIIPQSTKTSNGGGNQPPVIVFTTKGRTLMEAFNNTRAEAPRYLYFSHSSVMVLSQSVAKQGIEQIVDFYLRQNDRRETTKVVLTAGQAKDILEVLTPQERIPGSSIEKLITGAAGSPYYAKPIEIHDLATLLASDITGLVIPEIKVSGNQEEQTSLDALKKTRSAAVIKLGGMGVMNKDKFAGWLTRMESLGASWITNRMEETTIVISCPNSNGEDRLSSFQVDRASTKLHPEISKGNLNMNVEIHVQGSLLETACKLNLKKSDSLYKLEKAVEKPIVDETRQAFEALQKMRVDALGFDSVFHNAYPKLWKKWSVNWDDQFSAMTMHVSVHVKIKRTGMIDNSFPNVTDNKGR